MLQVVKSISTVWLVNTNLSKDLCELRGVSVLGDELQQHHVPIGALLDHCVDLE